MPNEKVQCRYCHMTFRILISNKPRGECLKCSECGRCFCTGYSREENRAQVAIRPRDHHQWKKEEKRESGCFRS